MSRHTDIHHQLGNESGQEHGPTVSGWRALHQAGGVETPAAREPRGWAETGVVTTRHQLVRYAETHTHTLSENAFYVMSVSTLEENALKDIPQQLHLHQGHSVCPKCCSLDIWLKQHETAAFLTMNRDAPDFHDWIDEIKHCRFFVVNPFFPFCVVFSKTKQPRGIQMALNPLTARPSKKLSF